MSHLDLINADTYVVSIPVYANDHGWYATGAIVDFQVNRWSMWREDCAYINLTQDVQAVSGEFTGYSYQGALAEGLLVIVDNHLTVRPYQPRDFYLRARPLWAAGTIRTQDFLFVMKRLSAADQSVLEGWAMWLRTEDPVVIVRSLVHVEEKGETRDAVANL